MAFVTQNRKRHSHISLCIHSWQNTAKHWQSANICQMSYWYSILKGLKLMKHVLTFDTVTK